MEKNRPNPDQVPLLATRPCQGEILLFSRNPGAVHNIGAAAARARGGGGGGGGKKTYPSRAAESYRPTRGETLASNMHIASARELAPRKHSVISTTATSPSTSNLATTRAHSFTTALRAIFVAVCLLIAVLCHISPTCQQDAPSLCPRACKCDPQNREVLCNGPLGASSLPHILDPGTKRMVFNNTQISQTGDLTSYQSLEILDLAFNRLTTLDLNSIISQTRLITLNASHNNIVDLRDSALSVVISKLGEDEQRPFRGIDAKSEPDELKRHRKSKINAMELDLSHNQIPAVRNYLFMRWHKLQRLDLSYNSIDALFSESLVGLNKLEHLNLRGNRLTSVDASVFQAIAKLPGHFGPADLGFISMLKQLDLSENPLATLEDNSFLALAQAQTIQLDSCGLRTIRDQAFEGLASLVSLSLANNDLQEVPSDALGPMGSLKHLDMSLNRIHTIRPYAFKNLYYLEELHLNNGSLGQLQAQAFNGLGSLRKLDVSHSSNLSSIDSSLFENLPKLTYLNLFMCSLTSLQAPDNILGHALTIMDLRANSLTCDCDLKWLTSQLKRLNESAAAFHRNKALVPTLDSQVRAAIFNQTLWNDMLNLTCARPPALAGKPVIGLPDNKLECIKPSSPLNIQIGFASLLFMMIAMTTVCMVNFYRNEKHLIGKLKENIAQNRISMMSPYVQDLPKSRESAGATRETQLDCTDYEPVDYGPIYTVPGDQYMTTPSQQQQHTIHQL